MSHKNVLSRWKYKNDFCEMNTRVYWMIVYMLYEAYILTEEK